MNFDTSIGQLFQEYGPKKDILFSKDYNGDSIINAGNSHRHVIAALTGVVICKATLVVHDASSSLPVSLMPYVVHCIAFKLVHCWASLR